MHYDTFAYLKAGRALERIKYCELNAFKRIFTAYKVYKKVNEEDYFQCASAFGGVGIYKWEFISGLRYETYIPKLWNNCGSYLCEHILFNSKAQGKKYIARKIEVCYQTTSVGTLKFILIKQAPVLHSIVGLLRSII